VRYTADVLSAVEFDETGQFLATGDKGGRIVVFERAESKVRLRLMVFRRSSPPSPSLLCVTIFVRCNHGGSTVEWSGRPGFRQKEKHYLRVPLLHGVSVTRCRVRLPEKSGD